MASLRQIKSRLKSVNNTKKLTYAMKLVSAAKLRNAQASVVKSREYTNALSELVQRLSAEVQGAELSHPLLEARSEVKNVRLIVVGASRGLCGGYNSNLNRKIESSLKEIAATHPAAQVETVLFGKKPAEYFRRINREYLESFEDLHDDPNRWPIDELCRQLEHDFIKGDIDEVYIIFTRFKSAMSQTTLCEKLLPLDAAQEATPAVSEQKGLTIFEPNAKEVFTAVIPRVVRSRILQGALESKASEHGARMAAMDAATKNAGEIAYKLRLKHNKVRQSNITSQLLDIVGGAEALNK